MYSVGFSAVFAKEFHREVGQVSSWTKQAHISLRFPVSLPIAYCHTSAARVRVAPSEKVSVDACSRYHALFTDLPKLN